MNKQKKLIKQITKIKKKLIKIEKKHDLLEQKLKQKTDNLLAIKIIK